MEINGKIYRNLEGQVAYLTEKWDDLQDQINDVRTNLTHYIIVATLPAEDIDTSAVYLVGPKGTAPNTYYEEWVYVETSEDVWAWEKLGDTASVDLSGYLEKMTGTPSYPLAYVLLPNGNQGSITITANAGDSAADTIVRRTSAGEINVPVTPSNDSKATSKKFVDDNFLAKDTSTTSYAKAYYKKTDGTQDTISMSSTPNQGFVVQYNTSGTLRCKDPLGNGEDVVNLSYANDHYLAKNTATSSYGQVYGKTTDGNQVMWNVNGNPVSDSIPLRFAYGQIKLPNQTTYPPTDDDYAVSKRYVNDIVGQLLYLHDLEIITNVDATNKLYVKAYLINGSATPITEFNRQLYRRIDVQWGAFGPNMANATAVAVTKLPDGFRQDEFNEPFIGFLYQYISGGNLVSDNTNSGMSSTITDTVLSW